MKTMSEDAKAILLLCGHLGGDASADPLDQREYNTVVRWLVNARLRPSDLLNPDRVPELAEATGLAAPRLNALLKRGVKLGFAVEEWNQSGIWVTCRSDPEYPARYKSRLKEKAPPILFCAGEQGLLRGGGLAIVGSRNVDSEGDAFAREVAERCAREGMPVVSGGARGVDQIAMSAALEAGGVVVGVLADSLLRRSVSRDARPALANGRLLLISPYHPKARFSVGAAMGRNKLVYGLSDYGLVISSDFGKGGTWEGAREELKRPPPRTVFVRTGPGVPKGNVELLKLGATAFPAVDPSQNLAEALENAAREPSASVSPAVSETPEFPALAITSPSDPHTATAPVTKSRGNVMAVRETLEPPPEPSLASKDIILDAVRPLIIGALDKARTSQDLAKRLNVTKPQMDAWLKQLAKDQVIEERTVRNRRMFSTRRPDEEFRLS